MGTNKLASLSRLVGIDFVIRLLGPVLALAL